MSQKATHVTVGILICATIIAFFLLVLHNTAPPIAESTDAKSWMYQRLSLRFIMPQNGPSGPQWPRKAHKEYKNSSDFYTYSRAPPHGWEGWLQFAKEKRCILEQYSQIEQDLKPYRRKGITQSDISAAAALEYTSLFTVRNGTVSSQNALADPAAATYLEVLHKFAHHLPDMQFVVNVVDEPRVLLGWHILTDRLLPVFSQSKINGCFSDITIPTWMNSNVQPVQQDEVFGWQKRKPVLYFRGTSTGGHVQNDTAFSSMHRQRLIEYAQGRDHMDFGFVGYVQCHEEACQRMAERYGLKERTPEDDTWLYKYIMILDGNTFSSRLMKTLTAGSLIFRSGLFSEWFDERIHPYVHYLPVKLDFSNLQEQLEWALGHDKEAQAIAEQAALQARMFIRAEDIECYWYRLLLEYAALVKK